MQGFALLFPGQGSQSVGMLSELASADGIVRETFKEAGDVLDIKMWSLVADGPAEELNRTELTQPAMLAGGVAVWRAWKRGGGSTPRMFAGHSLGEYSALVAAGALDFAETVALVSDRGRFMQEAVPAGTGAMAAILGLDDDIVEAICRESAENQVVTPANYNSPGQLVIAGDASAVERAMHKCREAGAKRAMMLPVSVPSHCPLMEPAAARLGERLKRITIRSPQIPVLHNADIKVHDKPEEIRKALVDQLCSPVRWTHTVHRMCDDGILHFGECGPGRVLCGLGRRIRREAEWAALESPGLLDEAVRIWKHFK